MAETPFLEMLTAFGKADEEQKRNERDGNYNQIK